MRQLTDEERALTIKGIERLKKRNEFIDYIREYNNLMLNGGLEENYSEQLKEYKTKLKEADTDFKKKYSELMIKKGLKVNYDKKLRDVTDEIKQIEEETNNNNFSIKSMEKQLKFGVEEKKKTEESKSYI